ncbi:hypothetical protein AX15_004565 [Amanita polypyramis BW_CC]|nr:hypothetical protein AX15_004565 [Amanita polypyramis BW_CC]
MIGMRRKPPISGVDSMRGKAPRSTRNEATGAMCPVVTRSAVFDSANSPTTLLALPHDMLERILLYLDAEDVRKCTLVSMQINRFIRSSVILRYRLACYVAGVVDNPYCTLSFAERYDALMKREKAWCRFQPAFIKSFDDAHEPFPICNLTSGVYLYGDNEGHNLHCCFLPSTPDDVLQWITIPSHAPTKNWNRRCVHIHGVGVAVDEHDLMINVILSTNVDQSPITYSMYMILLQFSTREYHPLAHCPRIDVQDYERGQRVTLEIAGDSLALLVKTHRMAQLFIFDWKTGHKRLQHQTSENAYSSSLAFASPEILIVPNLIHGQYEVWKIPKEADSVPHQVLGLCFPVMSKGCSIFSLYNCCGRPNPHNVLRASPKPFHTSADETMIITIVNIIISPLQSGPTFALFMRRRSLLETITNLIETGAPPPFDLHHHFNKELIDSDDSGTSYSLSFSMDPQEAFSGSTAGEVYSVNSIPWSGWGPPISRWIDADAGDSTETWITTSAGQRWIRLEPVDDSDERYQVNIIDFNPYNIHNLQDNLPGKLVVGRKGDYFDHRNVFAEEIKMGLGCTMYTAPEVYDCDIWFMDDENVLGLKSVKSQDDDGRDVVEKMTVFHFG